MNVKKVKILMPAVFVLFLVPSLHAQCFKGNTAVGPGEYLAYDVSYQLGPAWTNIAQVTFTSVKELYSGKNTLHFKLSAKTYPTYDHLYKVRDYYESWVIPETFQPVRFQRYTLHNENTILLNQLFNARNSSVYFTYRLNTEPVSSGTFSIGSCVFDMVSSIYFTRTQNIDYLRLGTPVPVSAMYGNETFQINLIAAGREIITTRDGKKYHCMKFRIKMPPGITIFKENSEVLIWLTADKNKIPVYIEAEIKVGSIKVYLKEANGLLNPLTALLK